MKKLSKSGLYILCAVLIICAILFFTGVYDGIVDYLRYEINYYTIFFIILLVSYFILILNIFRPQKWNRWIGIFLVCVICVFIVYALLSRITWVVLTNNNNVFFREDLASINSILSIVISIYGAMLVGVYKKGNKESKKRMRIALIVLLPFLVVTIRAGLTKLGVIQNWFNIDILTVFNGDSTILEGYRCKKEYTNNYRCCDGSGFCTHYTDMDYPDGVWKPIIYLYPTTETKVHVKLGNPKNLSHTYPKYNPEKGRNVIAEPNGDLKDIDTGRKLYALYREGKSDNETDFDEGFVVAGKDIIPLLEEKLAILGLNEREAEEFIVYWLPQMEGNAYNLIRFETKAEQDENMLLNITPKPDIVIRIMMDWKAIDEPIDIPEQQLSTPERTGFTVVEWGGSPRS